MKKVLSVIVPSYNIEKYIDEVIVHYFVEEVLPYIQIIFVNDGSTDRTREILETYQLQYPDVIQIINKKNGGHGSAINTGIEYAQGTYFKVVDGDDWVDENAFKKYVLFLRDLKEEVEMIYSPHIIQYVNENRTRKITFEDIFQEGIYDADTFFKKEVRIQMHGITYRTEILQKNKIRLDENMFYVDQEYVMYPLPYVKKICFFHEAVYQYRVGTAEQSMNIVNRIKYRNMHKQVIKGIWDCFGSLENKSSAIGNYFDLCIAGLINMQLELYLLGSPKQEMYGELKTFLIEIEEKCLKHRVGMCKLLWVLKLRYCGYLLLRLARRLKKLN